MAYAVYLIVLLAWMIGVPLFIKHYRKGKTVAGGVVTIAKGPSDTVFEAPVRINGFEVTGLFDTGASETTIGIDLARQIGFDTSSLYFDTSTETAAGKMHAAIAKDYVDEFQVGSITVRNLGVGINRFGGWQCLVGMNFFDTLDSFEINGRTLTLRKSTGAADFDGKANQRGELDEPRHAMNATSSRIAADCPYCAAKMNLPSGRKGTVRCHSCGRKFLADTGASADGRAKIEVLPLG